MIQIYLLSVLVNGLAGYILITEKDGDEIDFKIGLPLNDDTFRLILGILAIVTGILKLLSSVEGDVAVVGDLVPAIVGFLAGFILAYEYYKGHSAIKSEGMEKVELLLVRNKRFIGFIALLSAGLHFLFPQVLLL